MQGILYIVATPIGNLEDVSLRAIKVLSDVDIILAEDTRVTQKLIAFENSKYQIPTSKLLSYHQHSSDARKFEILQYLQNGKNIALVTDAGTPGVSDPGNELIDFLMQNSPDLKVIPVPGPSSITTALSVSGFRAGNFEFIGYFPKKGSTKMIDYIGNSGKTIVYFDSPYRIIKNLKNISKNINKKIEIFIAQEMTKLNERYFRGTLENAITHMEEENKRLGRIKGEIVVVIGKVSD